jgi:hypothetical protein
LNLLGATPVVDEISTPLTPDETPFWARPEKWLSDDRLVIDILGDESA